METWRQYLYLLGILSNIAFMSRFLLQWRESEKAGKPVVSKNFWTISLFGNLTLLLHSLIQLQYHVAFTQTCNSVISWRNLDLMNHSKKQLRTWKFVALLILLSLSITTSIFFAQAALFNLPLEWFRSPTTPWQQTPVQIAWQWHLVGFAGLTMFASRFWIQWWMAEKEQRSYLGLQFWWMSFLGAVFSLIYFYILHDYANMVGPAFGLIPYLRNIMLMRQQMAKAE